MARPGIKGSVFAGIVDQVRRLRDAGRIPPEEIETRLGAEGAARLDQKIHSATWYPIELYGAIRELLRDFEGGGKDDYTIAAGARSARRLIEGGLYQQLDFLTRWHDHVPGDAAADSERRSHFRRQLVLVSTIHNTLFNFGNLKINQVSDFPDRFQLEYWDDGVMPRVCRLAVLGFWNELSLYWSRRGLADLWVKIDADDHYMLRMTRDIAEI